MTELLGYHVRCGGEVWTETGGRYCIHCASRRPATVPEYEQCWPCPKCGEPSDTGDSYCSDCRAAIDDAIRAEIEEAERG